MAGRFRQAAVDDVPQGRIERRGLVADDGGEAFERAVAGEQLVEHRAEAENIRARIGGLALGLFGSHVGGRAHDRHGLGGFGIAADFRQTEIEQLPRSFGGEQDVGGLQIAMQNASAVGFLEGGGDFGRDSNAFVRGHRTGDGLAFDEFEHQVVGADVVDLADVRMIEGGDGVGFLFEACFTGSQSPILKVLETMRVPGFSSASSLGRSCKSTVSSRNNVTTVEIGRAHV